MSKTVLNLIEINLLLNSEEPKNTELYGNLYSVLSDLRKLKAVSFDSLYGLDDKARTALLHSKKDLIDTTVREWRATTTIIERPQRDMVCELCNTPIKYLCYIFNFKNNTELRVGSECIKKFPNMEGYTQHSEQLKTIHKNQKVIARRNKFYEHFSNCEEFISNAEKYFSTIPILLPYELYSKLESTIARIRLIFTKYVNEDKKPFSSQMTSFELFQLATDQYNQLKLQSDDFVIKNKNKPLICKRKEIDWLTSQNKHKLLEQISKNQGCYNLSTLKQMTSYSFVLDYKEDIFERNQSQLFRFTRINSNAVYFSFVKQGYQPSLSFKLSLQDFVQEIVSECIFNHEYTYSLDSVYTKGVILNTTSNIESIKNYIADFVYNFNCAILFDDKTNNLILCRRSDKAIRTFYPYQFISSYSSQVIKSDDDIKKYIFSIIKGNNSVKWISTEEQAKQGIDDKINKLYKEQYLDIKDHFIKYNKEKYVEITTYRLIKDIDTNMVIDFNHPEYIRVSRKQIRLTDNSVKNISYAIYVSFDNLTSYYSKNTLLLIQETQSVKNGNIIYYTDIDKKAFFIKCNTIDGYESIFKHISLSKTRIKSYGRVMYAFTPNLK